MKTYKALLAYCAVFLSLAACSPEPAMSRLSLIDDDWKFRLDEAGQLLAAGSADVTDNTADISAH